MFIIAREVTILISMCPRVRKFGGGVSFAMRVTSCVHASTSCLVITNGRSAVSCLRDLCVRISTHEVASLGTPISTSIMDVKYQLEFLGVQDVNDYLKAFKASAFQRVKDRNRAGLKRANRGLNFSNDIGPFTFFMRSLLMRHTQTQKYVGTNTTLMSLPKKVRIEITGRQIAHSKPVPKD